MRARGHIVAKKARRCSAVCSRRACGDGGSAPLKPAAAASYSEDRKLRLEEDDVGESRPPSRRAVMLPAQPLHVTTTALSFQVSVHFGTV